MVTPGWLYEESYVVSKLLSEPPQLLETIVAPRRTAVFTPAARSVPEALLASTRRILQAGQPALTMSRSSVISPPQEGLFVGSGLALPPWLTFWKQPLAVVQGGSPNCAR